MRARMRDGDGGPSRVAPRSVVPLVSLSEKKKGLSRLKEDGKHARGFKGTRLGKRRLGRRIYRERYTSGWEEWKKPCKKGIYARRESETGSEGGKMGQREGRARVTGNPALSTY